MTHIRIDIPYCETCGALLAARERCVCDSRVECECGRPAIPALGFCHTCKRRKKKAFEMYLYHNDPAIRERHRISARKWYVTKGRTSKRPYKARKPYKHRKAYKAVISDIMRELPMALYTTTTKS